MLLQPSLLELPPLRNAKVAGRYSYWTGFSSEKLWLTPQGRFYCAITDDVEAPGHENPLRLSGRWWIEGDLVRVKYAERRKSRGMQTAFVPLGVPDGLLLVPQPFLPEFSRWVVERRKVIKAGGSIQINTSYLSNVAPGSPLSPLSAPKRFLGRLRALR